MLRISSFMGSHTISAAPNENRSGAGPRRFLLPLIWILLGALVLAADYGDTPGLHIRFPMAYIVPVVLAARFSGPWWGLGLAFALPLVHLFVFEGSRPSWTAAEAAVAAMVRIDILALAALVAVREAQRRTLLREVRSLRGVFNVCTSCRRIRGREGLWMPAEEYIATCPEAVIRHCTCSECVRAYLGHLLKRDAEAWRRRQEHGTQEALQAFAPAPRKLEGGLDPRPRSRAG
jgi:hypothetical protein